MSGIEPIRASISVRADAARAFEVFTRRIDTWWPLERHSRAVDIEPPLKAERVDFEERVGGQVLEHLSNGQVLPWGEVLVWEPPTRFVLAWKPNASPRPPTELEIRFTPQADGTLVELEHRGWERLGDVAQEARAGYGEEWLVILGLFEQAIEKEVA